MTNFIDVPIFNFINHTLSNPFFNFAMPIVSLLGRGELYFLTGLLLLFSQKKELKMLGLAILAGLTISYCTVALLKISTARPRPFIALANVILLGPAEKGYSFPSNHAVTAFMFVSLLTSQFKSRILFYMLAVLMAFSRVYVGVHYPSDVIAGASIGITIGLFLAKAMRNTIITNN